MPIKRDGTLVGTPALKPTAEPAKVLTLEEAENWGDVWTVGTGDTGDVPAEQVLEALRTAYRAKLPVGLDTEFITDDIDRNGAHRSLVHVLSLGIPAPAVSVRAGPVAQRVVVGSGGLAAFRTWFASPHTKLLYNAPADLHPLLNMGYPVDAWSDLLPLSRYLNSDHKDHSLKFHIQNTLGYRGQGEYKENFYRHKIGAKGLPTKAREPVPLVEIVPGHPLWEKLKVYAALDAKATVELFLTWRARGVLP